MTKALWVALGWAVLSPAWGALQPDCQQQKAGPKAKVLWRESCSPPPAHLSLRQSAAGSPGPVCSVGCAELSSPEVPNWCLQAVLSLFLSEFILKGSIELPPIP